MPKIAYIEKRLSPVKLETIERINEIIDEYIALGMRLSLRTLFYQFVARNLLPNTEKDYKWLGDVVSDARMLGLTDWNAIVDHNRELLTTSSWSSTSEIIKQCAESFKYDIWLDQPYYVEVWIEKAALIGVIESVCEEFRVPYIACKGYTSMSEIWRAGHYRIAPKRRKEKKKCRILYLGDHDPSGLDMTRDIQDRLHTFAGFPVEVRRLALNYDQIEVHKPPPNPTKLTDSRAPGYVEKHGRTCWELDALEPTAIAELIRDALLEVVDHKKWRQTMSDEDSARSQLEDIAESL